MELFGSVPSIIIACLAIALNALAATLRGRWTFALTLASIALHVALAPVMLLSGSPLSELALVYSASFFAHLLPIFIIKKKGEDRDL